MAKWPMARGYRSRGTVSTGEADAWREVENMWATVGEVATKIYIGNEQSKLTRARIQQKASDAELAAELQKETDVEKYPAIFAKYDAINAKLQPKGNGLAARLWSEEASSKAIDRKRAYEAARDDRVKENLEVEYEILLKQGIESGDFSGAEKHLPGMVAVGGDLSNLTKRLEDAREVREYDNLLHYAKTEKGARELLENYKDENGKISITKGPLKDLKDPGKIMVAKNLAMSSIGEKERIRELLITGSNEQMAKDAGNFQITNMMKWQEIQNLDITESEKIKQFDKFAEARRKIVRGLADPFNTTTDELLRKDMMERASNKTLTPKEINDAEGVYISTPDADDMRSTLAGKSNKHKLFEDSVAAQNLIDTIAVDYPPKEEPEMHQFAAQRYLGILRDAIKENPNWTDREKKEQALRVGRQFQREDADGILETELERTIDMTTEQRAEEIERDLNKIDLSKIPKTLVYVNSLDEIEKLEKGTEFEYQGKRYRRK